MEELDVEQANTIAATVGRKLAARFPGSIAQDVYQEIWLWITLNMEEVLSWETDDEFRRKLYRIGYRVGTAVARKEKAQMYGYEIQDEFFYSTGLLRRILPLYLEEALAGDAMEDSAQFALPDREIKMDLDRAFAVLDGETTALLHHVFDGDDAEARTKAVAAAWELTEAAARSRVQRALNGLVDVLGGINPHSRRRVLSNSTAQAITRRDYSG